MNRQQIITLHKKIINLYEQEILPIVNKYFQNTANSLRIKSGENYHPTLVTNADMEINSLLMSKLPQLIPNSAVISEESEQDDVGEFTFIIDPIDGTHSFARNLDDWGISISLCNKEAILYSIIFYPRCWTKYYYAIKGSGSFDSDDNKIVLVDFFSFKPTFICAPKSRSIGKVLNEYTQGKMISTRAYGSAVFSAYTLFRGGTDILVFDDLNIWDIVSCVNIASEIGFTVKWFSNSPKYDGTVNLKKSKYKVMIYKPDCDIETINKFSSLIQETLS
ncbi:MAG: inositol monophosphatase family protein [bacterium]